MLLLLQKLSKLYSKLENHHQQPEANGLSAPLQTFQSDVSDCLNRLLLLNSKPESEILSLSWIRRCYELLPLIDTAFAKLVVDIDHPINCWEAASLHRYLDYNLHLLELLNSVTSSLFHLAHARLSFAHALTLLDSSPSLAIKLLKPIHHRGSSKDYKGQQYKECGGDINFSYLLCKEKVVNQALTEIQIIGIWVRGVVLASLTGKAKPYMEIKQLIATSSCASLIRVDSFIYDVIKEKIEVLRDVKELNDSAASLSSAIISGKSSDAAAKDLETRLCVFEKQLRALDKQVDNLFSKVFATRNKLLLGVRQRKQHH